MSRKKLAMMEQFLSEHTRKGARCAECQAPFKVHRGDGKKLAIFPNGAGGIALYVLCAKCGQSYRTLGLAGYLRWLEIAS